MDKEKDYCLLISKYLSDNKAEKVITIDINTYNTFTKYIIISTANSSAHQEALKNIILKETKKIKLKPIFPPEKLNPWIIIDFSFFLTNIFIEETRKFYNIEDIWKKGQIIYTNN